MSRWNFYRFTILQFAKESIWAAKRIYERTGIGEKRQQFSIGRGIFQWWTIPHFSRLKMAELPINYDKSQAVFHFERHIPTNATETAAATAATKGGKNIQKEKSNTRRNDNILTMRNVLWIPYCVAASFHSLHFDENGLILSASDNCVARKVELQHITHRTHQ